MEQVYLTTYIHVQSMWLHIIPGTTHTTERFAPDVLLSPEYFQGHMRR